MCDRRVVRDKVADLRQPETAAGSHQRVSPLEMARTLSEVKDALQSYEMATLAGVAATLAEAAESLAYTARELHEIRGEEWMDAEEYAAFLKRKTRKQWETIAPILPRHYITERGILYSRHEIDEWLRARTSPLDV
jgi:hypothetical protein